MKQQTAIRNTGHHMHFFDHIRNITMACVVLYHAVIAYSTTTTQFPFHDSDPSLFADYVRWGLDVFIMPVFFFIAGYFAMPSLKKNGTGGFLKAKFKRLGVPWLIVMASIVAPAVWGGRLGFYFSNKQIVGLGDSMLNILKGFTEFRMSALNEPQMHLWFITLLLFFFIVFALSYHVKEQWIHIDKKERRLNPSGKRSFFIPLLAFGGVISFIYCIAIYFIPKINAIVHLGILSFEPTKLPSNLGYFLLGVYGYSRNWFSGNHSLGSIAAWFGIFILSLITFFIAGMPILLESAIPTGFSMLRVTAFAAARSFLCLSIVILFLILGSRFWNSTSKISKTLSKNSYYIYIIHMFVVLGLLAALINWQGGPTLVKIAIVFACSLPISYLISNFVVMKFPRVTAAGLLILCISMVILLNPHRYEREFDERQARFAKNSSLIRQDDSTLRKDAILLYHKALKEPSHNEEAFETLSMAYHRNEDDYEILSYLARITVVIGDSRNLLEHMVHDAIGYTWMDKAVEHDPDNINIRFNRGVDSFNKPDVFADRWKYAEIDFIHLAGLIQSKPEISASFKEQVFSYLAKIYEKEGNVEQMKKYKKLLAIAIPSGM